MEVWFVDTYYGHPGSQQLAPPKWYGIKLYQQRYPVTLYRTLPGLVYATHDLDQSHGLVGDGTTWTTQRVRPGEGGKSVEGFLVGHRAWDTLLRYKKCKAYSHERKHEGNNSIYQVPISSRGL